MSSLRSLSLFSHASNPIERIIDIPEEKTEEENLQKKIIALKKVSEQMEKTKKRVTLGSQLLLTLSFATLCFGIFWNERNFRLRAKDTSDLQHFNEEQQNQKIQAFKEYIIPDSLNTKNYTCGSLYDASISTPDNWVQNSSKTFDINYGPDSKCDFLAYAWGFFSEDCGYDIVCKAFEICGPLLSAACEEYIDDAIRESWITNLILIALSISTIFLLINNEKKYSQKYIQASTDKKTISDVNERALIRQTFADCHIELDPDYDRETIKKLADEKINLFEKSLEAKLKRKTFLMAAVDQASPANLLFTRVGGDPRPLCFEIFNYADINEDLSVDLGPKRHSRIALLQAKLVKNHAIPLHSIFNLEPHKRKWTLNKIFHFAGIAAQPQMDPEPDPVLRVNPDLREDDNIKPLAWAWRGFLLGDLIGCLTIFINIGTKGSLFQKINGNPDNQLVSPTEIGNAITTYFLITILASALGFSIGYSSARFFSCIRSRQRQQQEEGALLQEQEMGAVGPGQP